MVMCIMRATASGDMFRVNPMFIEILKSHGMYTNDILKEVLADNGSVQNLDFLTDREKGVLKTAFRDQSVGGYQRCIS